MAISADRMENYVDPIKKHREELAERLRLEAEAKAAAEAEAKRKADIAYQA